MLIGSDLSNIYDNANDNDNDDRPCGQSVSLIKIVPFADSKWILILSGPQNDIVQILGLY
jgi:hypothetical protein